ncbi:MAG: ABC transporter permease [Anaerolineales bacterium]
MILFVTAIGTMIFIPYDEAIRYWRGEGLNLTPRLARPAWTNWFRREKWPESIYFDSINGTKGVLSNKEIVAINENMTDIRMTFDFEYTADVFPDDVSIFFDAQYDEKNPFVTINMIKPNGDEVEIESLSVSDDVAYYFVEEENKLTNKTGSTDIQQSFGDPDTDYIRPLKGKYELQVLAIVFEDDSNVDIQGVIYGKVFGLFGSDSQRRDLTIAMLWGTPIALAFGVVGATLTTVTTILIAAISAWYGGWLDEILQRITEINITIPSLAMAVLVYILYSKSIIAILLTMILMNIFGNSLKEYRAMFLQFRESPYIEAAKSYGASNLRIIFRYLMPRILQVMVPQLVISVPGYVFLEATLAFLGVITPYIPTWGKVISQALNEGAYWGHYFWILEPIILVLITGLAFAFVGYSLEQILNPRLRSQ